MNDFIALEVCAYCGKERGIAIQQYMKKLPRQVCADPTPCEHCIAEYKAKNVMMIIEIKDNTKYVEPTGRFIQLPFNEETVDQYPDHWAFCPHNDFEKAFGKAFKQQNIN